MIYIRAHGSSPGPTQRPWLAGCIAGAASVVIPLLVLHLSGAAGAIAKSLATAPWVVLVLVAVSAVIGGMLYSRGFGRAVNDRSGGWLFGLGFGFLLWMLGPTVLLQWVRGHPLVMGDAAAAVLGAHLIWGFTLGCSLPFVQTAISRRSLSP